MSNLTQLWLLDDYPLVEERPAQRFLRIAELPPTERPQARLANQGVAGLSVIELVSILMSGPQALEVAAQLTTTCAGLAGLSKMSLAELQQVQGVGQMTAARILAALELGRRLLAEALPERSQIRSPADVADLLMLEMGLLEQEQLRTVLLDTKNFVVGIVTIYTGSLNTAVVRVGEVFKPAVRRNSAGLIVVHNHPSSDPTPSPEDVRVTEMIIEAGRLLDIDVLDHVVIGRNRYVSMKERGLGFGS